MPMNATLAHIDQPNTVENTTAGAAMMVPQLNPRDSKNKNAVSDRVLASKRFSRNSYAV